MGVSVSIDYEKCFNPAGCVKCLQICPVAVFGLASFKETGVDGVMKKSYRIIPTDDDLCVVCNSCTEVCPEKCIVVKV